LARTFPLLIQTVRVEATQELSDVEAKQIHDELGTALREAIAKVHDKFEAKFPNAALVVDIRD
jgi:hypothetical protein